MAFTYDLGTNIGKVRLKIRDFDTTDATQQLFKDEEIQVFLDENNADLNLAAADALEAVAVSGALLEKAEGIGNYSFSGRGMAEALLLAASKYRDRSEKAPAGGWAEESLSEFNENQIIWNDILRTQG